MGKPLIHLLVWMRVPGDTVFSIGASLMAWLVFRLWVVSKCELKREPKHEPKHQPLLVPPIKPQTT